MKYLNLGLILSFNCLFNFIIGNRGCGKTYGCKKRVVKLFLEKGFQFVYLRRFDSELSESAEGYFNDIIKNNEFPDTTIEYKEGCYYINGEIAGYAMALTKAKDYKSSSFPDVWTIIFDEFLIEDNGYTRFLKNEVKQFLGFYMSIDRYRGVTVFFLGNSTEFINPYTLFFNIPRPFNSDYVRKDDILLYLAQDEAFIKEAEQTRFGKLIAGTDFAEYAIKNKFADTSKTFLQRKTEKAQYYFTFIYKGEKYGIWVDYNAGKMFVSANIDETCGILYSLTVEDHTPNTLLINQLNKSPFFKNFIENYKMGNVYFESQKIKSIVYDVIRLCVR